MAIESPVVNLGDLNPLWPTGAEAKNEGDDHLRNIKATLRQAFAGFTGAVVVTGTDGGAVNAYTLTPATALLAYTAPMIAIFSPTATNTGAVTLNISGLGVKSVLSVSGTALVSGDLVLGGFYAAIYNGTAFQLNAVTQNYIDQIVVSNTLPGVDTPANSGKFYTTDGTAGSWASIDGRGDPITAKAASGTAAQVINYLDGNGQSMTATGSFSLTTSNFPASRFDGVMLRLTNGGAYSITTTGVTWIKSDGTTTTTFSLSGYTLQSAGTDMILFFSYGDGIVYAKVMR